MNQLLEKARIWATDNKGVVIKVGAGILGAILGAVVAGLIGDGQIEQEGDVPEWMLEEGDEEQDEDLSEENDG